MATVAAIILCGYLIGSVPAGYLLAKMAGVDIRTVGSGNIGATNVLRTLGKRYGYSVFAFDFLKGIAAVKLSILLDRVGPAGLVNSELAAILGGTCSVLGHSYPVWLKFRGGKGVATSGGVIFGLMPIIAAIAALIWIILFYSTGYVSLASVVAICAIPIVAGISLATGHLDSPVLFYFSLCLAVIVTIRHRSNLSRLVRGKEWRFDRR